MPKLLQDPKKKMLLEVERLLAQGGYTAVTVRAVAQGCAVGVGTVYNYFPSKEALLAEYLLTDWRQCIAAIEEVRSRTQAPEPVARCIHSELLRFTGSHKAIFQAEGAKGVFAGSFSQYHSLLRSQLAAPLRPFCSGDFAAEFLAEALLTWTVAGKEFCEIWDMLYPLTASSNRKGENHHVQL